MPVRHLTLTPDAVATVSVPSGDFGAVAILHRANVEADVWAAVGADPSPEGDDAYLIPAGTRRTIPFAVTGRSVRLLSSGAVDVEVEF